MATIGPKLQIDNFAEYKKNIDSLITQGKTLDSAMKLLESTWDKSTTAQEKAAGKAKILAQEIEAQKAKVAQIAEVVAKATEMYGADSEEVAKWTQAQNKAQAELNKMQHELDDCNDELNDQQKELQQSEKELKSLDKSTDEVTDSMEDAEKQTRSWGDVMKGSLAAEAIKTGFSKLVDLGKKFAGAMRDAAQAGMEYADEIETMSSVTGLATDTLQEYKYMTDLVDVDLNTITGSLTKVTNSMKSAKKGSGDAYEAYKKLHVEYKNSNGTLRKSEDVFNDVLKALKGVHNETEREQLAMTLLGKSAKDLNPLIEADADEIAGLKKEAHDMGYVLSGRALQALNKAQDGMDRMGKAVEGTKNRFAVGMAPAIEKVADMLTQKLADPRVQQAISGIAEIVGNVLVGAFQLLDLVTGGLIDTLGRGAYEIPEMFEGLDEEVEALTERTDGLRESSEALHSEYNDNARAILDERDRVTDLWKELQTLTDENGYVTDANKDRANYILGELNNALDTEYSMNGNIIEQYGTMKESVADVIEAKTALALLDAAQARYADATLNLKGNRRDIAEYRVTLGDLHTDLDRTDKLLQNAKRRLSKLNPMDDAYASTKAEAEALSAKYNTTLEQIDTANKNLESAIALDKEYVSTISTYGDAMAQAAEGNNGAVIEILSGGLTQIENYSQRRGEITEADIIDIKRQIAIQKQLVDDYKKNGYEGVEEVENQLTQLEEAFRVGTSGAPTWEQAWATATANMSESVTESMDKATTATETGTQSMIDTVDAAIPEAREKGEEMGTAIADGTTYVLGHQVTVTKMTEAGEINTASYAFGVTEGLDNAETAARAVSDAVANGYKSGDFKESGLVTVQVLDDGIESGVQQFYGKGKNIASTFMKRYRDGISAEKVKAEYDSKPVGEYTAEGIKKGLNAKAQQIARTAASVMRTVINTMRNTAEIASPSKITTGFGEFLGQGLINGMDRMTGKIAAAGSRMMGSALQSPSSFQLPDAAAYGGTTYNQQRSIAAGAVTVQVHAAPGQSAESIADAVMDKINRAINSESAVWA